MCSSRLDWTAGIVIVLGYRVCRLRIEFDDRDHVEVLIWG